ncbi:MAG: ATPase [Syntrophomonadaceae bacterium]|jgi:BMFP domain-containing protein YqiC|nr:ATPase [Syntrophomonadaceae bacterium]
MMEVFKILDELESLVRKSKKMPFSNTKVVVESDLLLDRVDRLRAVLPEELETARLIIAEKQRIIKEACGQADEYLEQSRERVSRMIDENEITRNAMKMSEEILAKAEEVAKEIRAEANEYAENLLNHMERVLKKGLENISQGKEELRMEMQREP